MLTDITYALAGGVKKDIENLKAICGDAKKSKNGFGFTTTFEHTAEEKISGVRCTLTDNSRSLLSQTLFTGTKHNRGTTLGSAASLLADHVDYVDHTGIIVPRSQDTHAGWQETKNMLTANSATYEYPNAIDGYDSAQHSWLFALPATTQEFRDGISDFRPNRRAAFEFVRDTDGPDFTVLQIDLQTNLTRAEIEKKFPGAFQVTDELGKYFSSVWVQSPWHGVNIRLDLRYREPDVSAKTPGSDWRNRKFLVTQGQRIIPD